MPHFQMDAMDTPSLERTLQQLIYMPVKLPVVARNTSR